MAGGKPNTEHGGTASGGTNAPATAVTTEQIEEERKKAEAARERTRQVEEMVKKIKKSPEADEWKAEYVKPTLNRDVITLLDELESRGVLIYGVKDSVNDNPAVVQIRIAAGPTIIISIDRGKVAVKKLVQSGEEEAVTTPSIKAPDDLTEDRMLKLIGSLAG